MKKLFDILRQDGPELPNYHHVVAYETDDETVTVATALREINQRETLDDVDGNPIEAIRWESSCLQRKCGACAMRINGRPRMACDTRIVELEGQTVYLEPLGKFPVVADLIVDRRVLFDNLESLGVWLEEPSALKEKRGDIAYEASRCLECGCCLEVCPNFSTQGQFAGMAAMVPLTRLLADADVVERARLAKSYRDGVFAGCGKSLACRNICPAEIEIDKLMARSNAAALWRRW